MADITKEQLAELDRLEREATAGKWASVRSAMHLPVFYIAVGTKIIVGECGKELDSDFIAALRNACRPLLDMIDSQAAETERLRAEREVTVTITEREYEELKLAAREIRNYCISRGCEPSDVPPDEQIAAILRKHFPTYQKLIESGPLPEGRLVYGVVDIGKDWAKRQVRWEGLPANAADNMRACGWRFYDYGELPKVS